MPTRTAARMGNTIVSFEIDHATINTIALTRIAIRVLVFFFSIQSHSCKVYITFCYLNFTICKYKFTFRRIKIRTTDTTIRNLKSRTNGH